MSKEYQEALNAYEMALDVNDNNPLTFLVRCECYLHLERKAEAEEAWNRAKLLMDTEEAQPTWENLAIALQTKLNQARS